MTLYCPTFKPDEYTELRRMLQLAAEIHEHVKTEARAGRMIAPRVTYEEVTTPADLSAVAQFVALDGDYFTELFHTLADGITEDHAK